MKQNIEAIRRRLDLGRRPLAALLEVSPRQLLEIERGLVAPPDGFDERIQDLHSKASVVRQLTAERAVAQRLRPSSISVNGPWVAMLFVVGGYGLLDLVPEAPHRITFFVVLLVFLVWAIARRTTLVRCSHCLQHLYLGNEQCPTCGARLE